MVFSNTTTKAGILQRVEFTLGLPDGAITGDTTLLAHMTSLVNEVYYDVVMEILRSQDSWDFDDTNHLDYAIATTPLVASQRDYSFPASLNILKIKRVDVTYDGANYYKATPIDSLSFGDGIGNTTTEDTNFGDTTPAYDVKADTIWIYPLPTTAQVAAGAKIRIEFYRELDDFTTSDTTQEPGIDRPWHELLPLGASMKYAAMRSLENAKSLKVLYDERMNAMRQYYGRKQDDVLLSMGTVYDITDNS
jgi:hypothetical protein